MNCNVTKERGYQVFHHFFLNLENFIDGVVLVDPLKLELELELELICTKEDRGL